jgi:hypothetical protein
MVTKKEIVITTTSCSSFESIELHSCNKQTGFVPLIAIVYLIEQEKKITI